MTFRNVLFWIHLVSGLVAGVIIVVMSATGIAIAFEDEILGWIDRDVQRVDVPADDATPLSVQSLLESLETSQPEFKATSVQIASDASQAYAFRAGRSGSVFVNQYTGEVRPLKSTGAHDFLHILENWHRRLGREGDSRDMGRLIIGISNLAFLVLCLTGLYLWFPRSWNARALKPIVWLVGKYRGKARDFNWHNVFGIWSLPVLIALVVSGVVMSFGWANRLVYTLAGEEPPVRRRPGAQTEPAFEIAPPEVGESPLSFEAILSTLSERFPDWESISFDLPKSPKKGAPRAIAPLSATVSAPALFAARGRTQLTLDPLRGTVLQQTGFQDRSAGSKARTWLRYVHTGEAFGLGGKIIASLATAGSLVLVYTGFALSWRRFFGRKRAAR